MSGADDIIFGITISFQLMSSSLIFHVNPNDMMTSDRQQRGGSKWGSFAIAKKSNFYRSQKGEVEVPITPLV
jgi:hypothetical protein